MALVKTSAKKKKDRQSEGRKTKIVKTHKKEAKRHLEEMKKFAIREKAEQI